MNDKPSNDASGAEEGEEATGRRLFLRSMGKWSGAAITAVVAGSWLASAPKAEAGAWVNRRGYGGGGWVNRGGGGWINRRGYGGGGWVNRW